jgi:hypothetical protein
MEEKSNLIVQHKQSLPQDPNVLKGDKEIRFLKFYSKLATRPAMNTVNPSINKEIQFNQ